MERALTMPNATELLVGTLTTQPTCRLSDMSSCALTSSISIMTTSLAPSIATMRPMR
jgi:hypothetical protein